MITRLRTWYRLTVRNNPAGLTLLAYTAIGLAGGILLALPFARDEGREAAVPMIDALFMSMAALSNAGLATLDPGTTWSFFGELVILVLIQIGGVGYMTVISFAYVILRDKLEPDHIRLTRSGFGLPMGFDLKTFVYRVLVTTVVVEVVGALVLAALFVQAGVERPIWHGIFHAVSAYCTAGVSLFPTSFEAFRGNTPVLMTVSLICYIGAFGFLVLFEVFETVFVKPRRLSFTTAITVRTMVLLIVVGTVSMWLLDPGIRALPHGEVLQNAFFQAMSASTTVGFNSVPIGKLSAAAVTMLMLLMFIGSSPAGTGGGMKVTTAATLFAVTMSAMNGLKKVRLGRFRLPPARMNQATATLVSLLFLSFCSVLALDLTGTYPFDLLLFEVISAISAVGLSMGLTSHLNDAGKLIITLTMLVGRVGALSFFMAFAMADGVEEEEALPQRDIVL